MSMVITWAHRDRPMQADTLVDHLAASIGPEAGTHYALQIRDAAGTLLAEKLNIAGTTATVTTDNTTPLAFRLWSIRDGFNSWQSVEWTRAQATPDAVTGAIITAATYVAPPAPTTTEISNRITTIGDFRVTSDGSLRASR